jgi:hypothetical protein
MNLKQVELTRQSKLKSKILMLLIKKQLKNHNLQK